MTPKLHPARLCKNVLHYVFGPGSVSRLEEFLAPRRGCVLFCIDSYFRGKALLRRLPIRRGDKVHFVDAGSEPTTVGINASLRGLRRKRGEAARAVVGVGGGSTLDTAKALSNLLTNGGRAEDYQGWDLVRRPGLFKIGVPTLSGTGAESSRTCVMIHPTSGLKLGMNSDHTVFDRLILDPDLTRTVPRRQFFYTGLDTYVHCIESLAGCYRNAVGDAFSRQALDLCREVFLDGDMKAYANREKLMIASYLGGCAIASSYVGVVHPFSAGLSVVLGVRHGLANCIVMTAMGEFYPKETAEFRRMAVRQRIHIPRGLCRGLDEARHRRLYEATVIHEKPLANALGPDFRKVLTQQKVREVFLRM